MKKYPIVKIKNYCEIISGSTPSRARREYWDGNISWITPKDLNDLNNRYVYESVEKITKKGFESCSTKLLPVGSVLFSSRAPIGYVAIAGNPICTNQGFKNFVPGPQVNSEYLYYYLKLITPQIKNMGRGATFKEVSKEVIERLDIVLPPVPVQKHIASILGKADLIRQKRAEAQRFAADLIPALFNEMFGDPVMNQKKWKTFKLGELCRIRRGGSPRPIENYLNGTIPWVKIGDGTMGDEIYINKTKQKITKEGVKKSLLLKPGALIFANCGVSLGFARILNVEGCVHDGWLAFDEIDDRLDKLFLLKLLNIVTLRFRKMAPSGTQPNLNIGIMKNFKIILPPMKDQKRFIDVLEKFNSINEKMKNALKDSEILFDAVQQKFIGN